jgi:hypothetical protein
VPPLCVCVMARESDVTRQTTGMTSCEWEQCVVGEKGKSWARMVPNKEGKQGGRSATKHNHHNRCRVKIDGVGGKHKWRPAARRHVTAEDVQCRTG